ncbi:MULTISPECIES: acyltransferase family protein [unclassified Colwellia]|uniref:acyltransferase family protein n=1 Tax=unclassified Colwellia TaxID=196834 RepID=UPI0015F479F0|nr:MULTISPECIES: acyltransferase family protein [unclassified Colwellia]MBA6231127.1 acyltransferase family protein [Colwellia sp. MB02u-7]MBA6235104.1 acyltransferase family protein [Colwellia sp. MB02u-11]MBA6301687.1 acyltransferase family protein [Colwellia sp. MB3u-22]MBA6309339.1 acyltransferase family protein [Colwellia sp. MB3u-64]
MTVQSNDFLIKYFIPVQQGMPERRYDLDWLRILVFGLLIFYHFGMLYVADWGFHFKSVYQSETLANFMLIVEPWRMASLWIISGIAIRFILVKVSLLRYAFVRSLRLLLPLLFGVLVIVPPQLYVEMTANGALDMSYWQFYLAMFTDNNTLFVNYQPGIWPHWDVNHLWYLRSLWEYSLAIILLLPLLNSSLITNTSNWLFKQHLGVMLLILSVPIFIIQITWEQDTNRYPLGFTFLLYGYLIGWHAHFWQQLTINLKPLLLTFAFLVIVFISFYNTVWLTLNDSTPSWLIIMGMLIYSFVRVAGVLTVLALAYRYLNKKSPSLSYFNEAVYPFYIVHQTIIIVLAYNLAPLELGPIIEPLSVILLTVLLCFICFEIIRRSDILKPLFGVRIKKNHSKTIKNMGYIFGCLLIIPIGLEIIF